MTLVCTGRAAALPLVYFPLFGSTIAAGFPSPADDFIEEQIDLNRRLIDHPSATYFLRVSGESMRDAGIFSGDLIIVDSSRTPKPGDVVVAAINGELTLKRIDWGVEGIQLSPENPAFPIRKIKEGEDLMVWGVVTYSIHQVRS